MRKVLICGDRHWKHEDQIHNYIQGLKEICESLGETLVVVEGEADGADTHARTGAIKYGLEYEPFPAFWETHDREGNTPVKCYCPPEKVRCRAAGPRRNQQMLDEGRPDLVIGFHDNIKASRGTKNMISRARKAGVPAFVLTSDPTLPELEFVT